jgi:RHH-type rel operon transcriptional repressor/antitoxin RelB
MTLSVRISAELENRLAILCKETKRSKSFYIKEALERYIEDLEDGSEAMQTINNPDAQYFTAEEAQEYLRREREGGNV